MLFVLYIYHNKNKNIAPKRFILPSKPGYRPALCQPTL